MGISRFIMRRVLPVPKVESFDRFLFVGPHPDDIEIGAGATIHKLTSMGKQVTMVICMDGRFGDGFSKGVKGDALAALRKEEAKKAAAVLGVKDLRFLDLRDGNGYDIEEMKLLLAKVIADVQPDIIFGPDPSEKAECHADHLNTGCAVRELSLFAPYSGIMENRYQAGKADVKAVGFFMTAHPNTYVKTGKHYQAQLDAVHCHDSQFPAGSPELSALHKYLLLRSSEYGMRTFSLHGEAFRVLTATQMHVLAEFG